MGVRWLAAVAAAATAVLGVPAVAHAADRSVEHSAVTVAPIVRVMPLGDSITYGAGSSTTSGYRAGLWNQLVERAGYGVDFVGSMRSGRFADPDNEGHPGWNIARISRSASGWVRKYRPDVVLLHVGTNDVRTAAGAGGASGRLSALIDQLRAAAPAATVLVAQIVPSADEAVDHRAAAYNSAIPGIVANKRDEHVRMVDLYDALAPSTDLHDWLHPNDLGYAKMATTWANALAGVLRLPSGIAEGPACLEATSALAGSAVRARMCGDGAAQRWTRAGQTLRAFGKCLDAEQGWTTVHLWQCTGGLSQRWKLRDDGSIYNVGSGRCLDSDADHLIARACDGTGTQRFAAR